MKRALLFWIMTILCVAGLLITIHIQTVMWENWSPNFTSGDFSPPGESLDLLDGAFFFGGIVLAVFSINETIAAIVHIVKSRRV